MSALGWKSALGMKSICTESALSTLCARAKFLFKFIFLLPLRLIPLENPGIDHKIMGGGVVPESDLGIEIIFQ